MESQLEVLDLNTATEHSHSMESRADFKYKGIFSVFNLILEWSNRYTSNGILPTLEQISRECDLEMDRSKLFVDELLGRTSEANKSIVALPVLDYVAGQRSELLKMVVFCRPGKNDGASAKKFYLSYQEKNINAVTRWLQSRAPVSGRALENEMWEKIEEGKLGDTQEGSQIARFFYSYLDDRPDRKKITYALHARPVIQKLIENRVLLYLVSDKSSTNPYKGIFYNKVEHLAERYRALGAIFLGKIIGSGGEVNVDTVTSAINSLGDQRISSMKEGERQLISELQLLAPAVMRLKKEDETRKKKESLEKVIHDLVRYPEVADISRLKIEDDDLRSSLLRTKQVLHSDYPVGGKVVTFILHSNNLKSALKKAVERFDRDDDDTEAMVLASMGVEPYLDNDDLRIFQGLEQRVLFNTLPWYVRAWRIVFGNSSLKPEESAKLKKKKYTTIETEKMRNRQAEAEKEKRKLVQERMSRKSEDTDEESAPRKSSAPEPAIGLDDDDPNDELQKEKTDEAFLAEETLKNIIQILDRAWDDKMLPNRLYLLEQLGGMEESDLVMFLKKWGRKDIFSFQIKHDKPEYQWPILITRRYIRQKGKAMLSKAMTEADEQRNAAMPNQEKFDVSTAIEDFLTRIMQKTG